MGSRDRERRFRKSEAGSGRVMEWAVKDGKTAPAVAPDASSGRGAGGGRKALCDSPEGRQALEAGMGGVRTRQGNGTIPFIGQRRGMDRLSPVGAERDGIGGFPLDDGAFHMFDLNRLVLSTAPSICSFMSGHPNPVIILRKETLWIYASTSIFATIFGDVVEGVIDGVPAGIRMFISTHIAAFGQRGNEERDAHTCVLLRVRTRYGRAPRGAEAWGAVRRIGARPAGGAKSSLFRAQELLKQIGGAMDVERVTEHETRVDLYFPVALPGSALDREESFSRDLYDIIKLSLQYLQKSSGLSRPHLHEVS